MNFNIKIEYQPLNYYLFDNNNIAKVPKESGIYYWLFFRDLIPYVNDGSVFISNLKKFYSANLPSIPSNFQNFKFSVSTSESYFVNKNNEGKILGLGDEKIELLEDFLNKGITERTFFNNFLKQILFQKPFYVGKADNLQNRLRNHISGKSKILKKIRELNIAEETIWIGYTPLDASFINEELNSVFEEVTQRILKPSFVERPG